jgi:hypothetical protein
MSMSLISRNVSLLGSPPSLEGRETLVSLLHPELCVVKGVMFNGRKRFLAEGFDAATITRIVESFTDAMVRRHGTELRLNISRLATSPLAGNWCSFESLVEYDRAIHLELSGKHPHVLALLGAASAEYGIGTVYKMLDSAVLLTFLQGISRMHGQFQKFGRVTCVEMPYGAQMRYEDYICSSPVFCASAIGFFFEAILRHGGRAPRVREVQCTCRGNATCTYDLAWQ